MTNASGIVEDTRKRFFPELAERYSGVRVSFEGQARAVEEGEAVSAKPVSATVHWRP